jgi:hypothetical protein
MTLEQHSHVPYLILIGIALNVWRVAYKRGENELPKSAAERQLVVDFIRQQQMCDKDGHRVLEENFEEAVNNCMAYRALRPTQVILCEKWLYKTFLRFRTTLCGCFRHPN